jgi:hypothetical protein
LSSEFGQKGLGINFFTSSAEYYFLEKTLGGDQKYLGGSIPPEKVKEVKRE